MRNTSAVPTWAPKPAGKRGSHPPVLLAPNQCMDLTQGFCHGVYGDLCIHDGYFQLQERYIESWLNVIKMDLQPVCPGISSRDTRSIRGSGRGSQHHLSPAVLLCISPMTDSDDNCFSEYMAGGVFLPTLTPSSSRGGRKPFPTGSGEKSQDWDWFWFHVYFCLNQSLDRNQILWCPDLGGVVLGLKPTKTTWCVPLGERVFLCTRWIKKTAVEHQTDLRRPEMMLQPWALLGRT